MSEVSREAYRELDRERTQLREQLDLFRRDKDKPEGDHHLVAAAESIRRIYDGMEGILRDLDDAFGQQRILGKTSTIYMDALRDYCFTPARVWEAERDRIIGFASLALQLPDRLRRDVDRFVGRADLRAPELRRADNEQIHDRIIPIREVLEKLRAENRVLVAVLYGPYSEGTLHGHPGIDIGIYLRTDDEAERMRIVGSIRAAVQDDTHVSILYLHDTDESPFAVQEALAGIHLVEPDMDALYDTYGWASDQAESMRFDKEGDERMKEAQDMMELMRRKLRSYQVNYVAGNFPECVSLLFFTLEALCRYALAGKGYRTHSHGEVRELMARHFVSSGEVDRIVYDHLFQLYHRRRDADFSAATFGKNEVDDYAQRVRHSIGLLGVYVDEKDREELLVSLAVSESRIGAE
ncbi:MAG: hypothetical protein A4E60_02379 [Syntrophorhabdus sp. PtaB.Bin047]|nr:MAG: hypothetical protein A4E60_02379 [Syntrophorhabdus sp. PtaB.Bin047]